VNGIDDAGKKDAPALDAAVKKDPEALKDLGKDASAILAKEPDRMATAANKAGDALAQVTAKTKNKTKTKTERNGELNEPLSSQIERKEARRACTQSRRSCQESG